MFRVYNCKYSTKGDNKYDDDDNSNNNKKKKKRGGSVPRAVTLSTGGEKLMALKDLRQFLPLVILVKLAFELRY